MCCSKKAGSWSATSTPSASKSPSTTQPHGRSASDPLFNSCIARARPLYNPRSGHLVPRGRRMLDGRPLTILCVTSYEKGQEFIRTCKAMGCRVLLLTVEKLRHAAWPFECIDEVFTMPEDLPIKDLTYAVSYTARSQHIDRIVALDEFDMENVSALREHLRIPGMGLTAVRYFRDKLAMRERPRKEGIVVPEFVHVLNYDTLREFMSRVPNPWLLKPRSQASALAMKKIPYPTHLCHCSAHPPY